MTLHQKYTTGIVGVGSLSVGDPSFVFIGAVISSMFFSWAARHVLLLVRQIQQLCLACFSDRMTLH
jgi:hypothetical protein